jgi:2-phosphosulfolactate phosphatase
VRVEIVRPADALEGLDGVVVIIDVFRASNTVLALLAAGAVQVSLVADLGRARKLKAGHPDWLLLGERGGLAPEGFEGGNSPANAAGLRPQGRAAILTTSAGTQAVHRLGAASQLFYGSFANASVLTRVLRRLDPARISFLPMGFEGREPAEEDDLAAAWLRDKLLGRRRDFAAVRQRLLACAGAERLRKLGQGDDLAFCTTLDSHVLVAAVSPGDPPTAGTWRS